ncbi:hypothetical protein MVEN_00901000 [Mycena venus]|uniref:Uncharacterized protein n=1 Tax=Mycena venus TaxID=2733690 RepID=A0A8H6YCE5_9AGAR|nr:hypothetical protein MVEN_00901000 [Mycena venus]
MDLFSISYMMAGMNTYIFLFFGIADICIVLFTMPVLKETCRLSLEEVQAIYTSGDTKNLKHVSMGLEEEHGSSSIDKM